MLLMLSLEQLACSAAAAYARSFTADGGQTVPAAGCRRHLLVSSPKEKLGESSPREAYYRLVLSGNQY